MKKINGLTKALLFVALFDLIFTIVMIYLFFKFQSVPDSLIMAVFAATIGETSATALIRKAKLQKEGELDELDN